VRITGGELRGRRLRVPATARPTEGRVREALFSIWMEELPGSRVLDLFAGSGAVALEAASRGALAVIAVEEDPDSLDLLVENIAAAGVRGLVEAVRGTLPGGLARLAEEGAGPFDLVFADPPYAFDTYAELLAAAEPLLARDGEIAIEHSSRVRLPEEVGRLIKTGTRRYGESALSLYRRGPE
jgi:16S rRNA (guanine966-N2)-methyltransferase